MLTISSMLPSSWTLILYFNWSDLVRVAKSWVKLYSPSRSQLAKSPDSEVSTHALYQQSSQLQIMHKPALCSKNTTNKYATTGLTLCFTSIKRCSYVSTNWNGSSIRNGAFREFLKDTAICYGTILVFVCTDYKNLIHDRELRPYWAANSSSASHEIPELIWKIKVHNSVHNSLPPVPFQEPGESTPLSHYV